MNILVFRYNISFIDPPLGVFGEIFPSVMIFPSGQSPREISSLKEIFNNYRPFARGIRRNISFSDDISLGPKPSGNIIPEGNI